MQFSEMYFCIDVVNDELLKHAGPYFVASIIPNQVFSNNWSFSKRNSPTGCFAYGIFYIKLILLFDW